VRRWAKPLLLAAALGLCLAGPASAGKPAPSRVLATGNDTPEYTLVLSRTKVAPGASIIQFSNSGQDAHNLVVQRVGSTAVRSLGEVDPGETGSLQIGHLRKGSKYRLFCSLPGHAALGMEAVLKTKNRR
jgi:plastocyanin